MVPKMKKHIVLLFTFILALSLGASVFADDGEHEKREHGNKSEYYEKSDDEGENENEYYNNQGATSNPAVTEDYWYMWSRKPVNNPNNALPITAPSELAVNVNGNITKLYFIPQEGQLFVSGDKIGNLLGAQVKYFPQSKIMVLTKDKYELIVRADSNAVYENRVKNPMPVMATSYENTVYLPVSVAANALGYRVTWDAGSNTLICVSI